MKYSSSFTQWAREGSSVHHHTIVPTRALLQVTTRGSQEDDVTCFGVLLFHMFTHGKYALVGRPRLKDGVMSALPSFCALAKLYNNERIRKIFPEESIVPGKIFPEESIVPGKIFPEESIVP
ncbi:hypothetical protein Tco_0960121, partial [Tanacetum coccineum]